MYLLPTPELTINVPQVKYRKKSFIFLIITLKKKLKGQNEWVFENERVSVISDGKLNYVTYHPDFAALFITRD